MMKNHLSASKKFRSQQGSLFSISPTPIPADSIFSSFHTLMVKAAAIDSLYFQDMPTKGQQSTEPTQCLLISNHQLASGPATENRKSQFCPIPLPYPTLR